MATVAHGGVDEAVEMIKEGTELKVPVIEVDGANDDKTVLPDRSKDEAYDESLKTGCEGHDRHHHHNHDSANGTELPHEEDSFSEEEEESDSGDEAWDRSSVIEAVFEQLEDDPTPATGIESTNDACTEAEALAYRQLLRRLGIEDFIRQTLETGTVTAKKLLTAFNIRAPFLEGKPDEAYYRILGLAIQREMQKRQKLTQWNTIDDATQLLKASRNVIVVTGAGISTSLGIPDFRSKHNGLYARLEHLGLSDPQEVFDIDLFREDPTVFYSVAKDILPETKKFTPTHAFIKMLQDMGKLLVNYTQNIDNIEGHAGVDTNKLIQCHGSFATATCQKCGHRVNGDEIHNQIKAGDVPRCPVCTHRSQHIKPVDLKRKRSSDHRRSRSHMRDDEDSSSDEDFSEQIGIMKPDITFFGENLPDTFHDRLRDTDYDLVDLVIVIGTSLKVAPVAEIPNFVSGQNESIPQIYISRDPCEHIQFDIELLGECDVVIAELCRKVGWEMKHEMLVDSEREIVVTQAGSGSQWRVEVLRDADVQGVVNGHGEGDA